ncbi:PaaI family thioesterase [Companilactobacillus sp. HBUAS56257]|uniref:PaaI family thioesterase n=1 Tax=Companilactobacillus sp. HBUAS56257 TaxID=3109360 RepID=UPI002FF125F0
MSLLNDLGIEVVEKGKHKVILGMEITQDHLDKETEQPGIISAMLSETAASIGANLSFHQGSAAITSVSLHSLNALKLGRIIVEAQPVKDGSNIQTWQATLHYDNSAISNSLCTITLKKIEA